MIRSYSMRGVSGPAARAVQLAQEYLRTQDPGGRIHDVQSDPRFQHRGVDLLWERSTHAVEGVEVKGDRNARRGNYFFELVSNLEKNTPGCFLYSEADLLLYVFVAPREIHRLPMRSTRQWFLENAKRFPLKQARTRAGLSTYTTVGAAVPVREVLSQVPGALRLRLPNPAKGANERRVSTR
jgi:hypothetical protein